MNFNVEFTLTERVMIELLLEENIQRDEECLLSLDNENVKASMTREIVRYKGILDKFTKAKSSV